MGDLCYYTPNNNQSKVTIINNPGGEIGNKDEYNEKLKKQNNELEKKQSKLIANINKQFNILNKTEGNKTFKYNIIKFSSPDNISFTKTININKNTKMNDIYGKLKKLETNLPDLKDISFFYLTCNISFLFQCDIPISKFNLDLNNQIVILKNNVDIPENIQNL